jgi:hypothetical protein
VRKRSNNPTATVLIMDLFRFVLFAADIRIIFVFEVVVVDDWYNPCGSYRRRGFDFCLLDGK